MRTNPGTRSSREIRAIVDRESLLMPSDRLPPLIPRDPEINFARFLEWHERLRAEGVIRQAAVNAAERLGK